MSATARPGSRPIPTIVQTLNPLVRRLLRIGLPMGDNALLTVRGRTSGQLRTVPITILASGGRQYVFAAFGEVNWVSNLRAAGGEAILTQGRRRQPILAVELTPDAATLILEDGLRGALKIPMFGAMVAGWYGVNTSSTPADFAASARQHAGFELRPA